MSSFQQGLMSDIDSMTIQHKEKIAELQKKNNETTINYHMAFDEIARLREVNERIAANRAAEFYDSKEEIAKLRQTIADMTSAANDALMIRRMLEQKLLDAAHDNAQLIKRIVELEKRIDLSV